VRAERRRQLVTPALFLTTGAINAGVQLAGAALASIGVTGGVVLIAQQSDVQQVNADAPPSVAAVASVATTAHRVHGHDSTRGKQFNVLALDLGKAQCVRQCILLNTDPQWVANRTQRVAEQNTSSAAWPIRLHIRIESSVGIARTVVTRRDLHRLSSPFCPRQRGHANCGEISWDNLRSTETLRAAT